MRFTKYVLMNADQDAELASTGKIVGWKRTESTPKWQTEADFMRAWKQIWFDSKQDAHDYVTEERLLKRFGCTFIAVPVSIDIDIQPQNALKTASVAITILTQGKSIVPQSRSTSMRASSK